jgi:hypothetical protein
MSEHTPENQEPLAEASQNDKVDRFRRKLGLGLGASAIFTLASRPVLAGACTTPSAAASGNLSQHGPVITCTGKTPAEWVALAQNTNPGNPNIPGNGFPLGGNVEFNDVFANGNGIDWPNGANGRLYEVMNSTSNPDNGNANPKPNPISKEFAAALLNIRGGFVPATVLTEMKLIGMWNDWLPDGIFVPKLGATWDTNDIITYLQTLQA